MARRPVTEGRAALVAVLLIIDLVTVAWAIRAIVA